MASCSMAISIICTLWDGGYTGGRRAYSIGERRATNGHTRLYLYEGRPNADAGKAHQWGSVGTEVPPPFSGGITAI
jgi:hypothetical protein